jgi:hypothetical protein
MGLVFRKSIRLPGGFRVNLSKSGIGVSAGVPGFRVGVGPAGGRVSAGIPGTGLGWVQSFGLGHGRSDHAPARAEASTDAAASVAEHEHRVAALTTLHRSSWRPWDWATVASTPAPPPAPPGADAATQQQARFAHQRWEWFTGLARGILAGDRGAEQAALDHLGPFAALQELGSTLRVAATAAYCVEAWLVAHTADVVPTEQPSLTATGKLSRKKLSPTRYWAIYQDHVASAAFRVAREVFALLPVPLALVHVAIQVLDTSTGHTETRPILSVAFDREAFAKLDLDRIDPSDALAGFEHNMDFHATTGFAPIEVLEAHEAPAAPVGS